MDKALLYAAALAFYATLAVYVASELYYNQTYWRLVLRKRRRSRWEFLLWIERIMLVVSGLAVILITIIKR